VQSLRDRKEYWLFPELKPGAYGRRTAKWGEWFSEFLRNVCRITDRRLVFHSFRHTFKDLARHSGIPEPIQRQLMGHGSRDVADDYGEGYSLFQLVAAIRSYRVLGLQIGGCTC
jgi:integrase